MRSAPAAALLFLASCTSIADTLVNGDAAARTAAIAQAGAIAPGEIDQLYPLLAHEDGAVRAAALQALRVVANSGSGADPATRRAVSERLLHGLRDRTLLPAHTRSAVLRLVALVANDPASVQEIDGHLDQPDTAAAAIFALELIHDPSADTALIARLEKNCALPVEEIIEALGVRRSAAAVEPLVALAGRGVAPDACGAALARIGDDRAEQALATMFSSNTPAATSNWLTYLDRRARAGDGAVRRRYEQILASGDSLPRARIAALSELARLPGQEVFETMVKSLGDANRAVRLIARRKLIRQTGEDAGDEIASALSGASNDWQRAELLRVLAARGDPRAETLVLATTSSPVTLLSATAFDLLGDMRGDAVEKRLLQGAKIDRTEVRTAALASLGEHAKRRLDAADETGALPLLHCILESASATPTLRDALRGVARVGSTESLTLVENLAARPGLREAVAGARLAIARELPDKTKAIAMLNAVYDASKSRGTRTNAIRALRARGVDTRGFCLRHGLLPRWHILGGFPEATEKDLPTHPFGAAGPDVTTEFASGDVRARWVERQTDHPDAIVDLKFLKRNEKCVAYAICDVDWKSDAELMLKIGSDDGVAVWVNGELVHQNFARRGVSLDSDLVRVKFRRGTNRLLLKITQGGGGFGFCARIADEKGKPIDLTKL